jgi:hypothetical protein
MAIPQEMKIRIVVPLEFITAKQTSGCMFTDNRNRAKVANFLCPLAPSLAVSLD